MGVDYIYLNQDKRQYYRCGIFGWGSHFSAIGSGPGARALAILLSERGTWKNDRVSVVADTSKEFDDIFTSGVDIEVEVELMLLDVDGLEWIDERLDQSIIAFTRMCEFAIQLRRPDVMKKLDKKFGVGKWQGRYEEYWKHNTNVWSQKVTEAGNRQLKILASLTST
jgi:hypothetical protein